MKTLSLFIVLILSSSIFAMEPIYFNHVQGTCKAERGNKTYLLQLLWTKLDWSYEDARIVICEAKYNEEEEETYCHEGSIKFDTQELKTMVTFDEQSSRYSLSLEGVDFNISANAYTEKASINGSKNIKALEGLPKRYIDCWFNNGRY